MHAALIRSYGPPEQFVLGDIPTPEVDADGILVHVHASSVNPIDWKIRSGQLKLFTGRTPPAVLGQDFAGVVERVGTAVKDYAPGMRVYGMTDPLKGGCYAQFVRVKRNHLALIPDELSFAQAAAIPLATLTAYQGLMNCAQLRAGARVVINGASGAVGLSAVQIAKAKQCHIVGICSGRNMEFVRGLGADEVLDYTRTNYATHLSDQDVFFDCAGTESFAKARGVLKMSGFFVTTEPSASLLIFGPLLNALRTPKAVVVAVKANAADLRSINELITQRRLKPVIAQSYSLEQIAAAHKQSETRRVTGKLVIEIESNHCRSDR